MTHPPGKGRSLSPGLEGGARRSGATQPRRTHRPRRLKNTPAGRDGTGRRLRNLAAGGSGKFIPGRAPRGPAGSRAGGMGTGTQQPVSAGAAPHTDRQVPIPLLRRKGCRYLLPELHGGQGLLKVMQNNSDSPCFAP